MRELSASRASLSARSAASGSSIASAVAQAVIDNARDGDVVLCMGAGSIGGVPAQIVERAGPVAARGVQA